MYQMGSLNHITLSNSISYNTGKPGAQEGNTEGDYEPVNPGFRNREQGISTIASYPNNTTHTYSRANSRGTRTVGMKNTTKATYVCICITIILALQIWNVIMIKYIEGKISKFTIKYDNLPIQKQPSIPALLSLISSKLDAISRDTNYNLPYLIINKKLPKDKTSSTPNGIFIPYGTRVIAYIDNFNLIGMARKSKRGRSRGMTNRNKIELFFDYELTNEHCLNDTKIG